MSAPSEPAEAVTAAAEPRWIEEPAAIERLLTHAAGKRLMLAIGGAGGPHNSLLLGSDSNTRQLVIDPPFPALPNPPMQGDLLSVSTRVDGAVVDFTTVYEDLVELGGEEAMVLRWPAKLRYFQRRSAYRLGIPRDLHVPPAIIRGRQGACTATLVDLSRFGVGALVPRSRQAECGETVDCTIRIGELEFSASAEVKSCIASLDRLRLGLQFGEISPAAASRLSAAVARLERLNLRKAADQRARTA